MNIFAVAFEIMAALVTGDEKLVNNMGKMEHMEADPGLTDVLFWRKNVLKK